jgi:hypothetical protein
MMIDTVGAALAPIVRSSFSRIVRASGDQC